MSEFNFAAYAKAIHAGAPSVDPTNMVKKLLDSIVMKDGVFNEKGSPYNITSKEALEWWNEEANIPPNIVTATSKSEIVKGVYLYFDKTIFQKVLLPQRGANAFLLIKRAIDDDRSIPQDTLDDWQGLLDDDLKEQYLAVTFLYAIASPNDRNKINKSKKKRKLASSEISADVNDFQRTLARLPKPLQIEPPEELADHELVYVSQLCAAYSDDAGEPYFKYKKVIGAKLSERFFMER